MTLFKRHTPPQSVREGLYGALQVTLSVITTENIPLPIRVVLPQLLQNSIVEQKG
jgi:hypothetical protein